MLVNIGFKKKSLKKASTVAESGNADVGYNIHYRTNLSQTIEINSITMKIYSISMYLLKY